MASASIRTLADLLARLGNVPPDRIRFHPPPGTATIQDVIRIHDHEDRLCELVEGVLLEKVLGYNESRLATVLITLLQMFVLPRKLGVVTGEAGTVELMPDLVRIPDVAFTSWDRLPEGRGPIEPVPAIVPNLAVEVLSRSNTRGEMKAKRRDYFHAGVQLVWEVNPRTRTVLVYTSPTKVVTLRANDILDGGDVLPGFSVVVKQIFAELDRHR